MANIIGNCSIPKNCFSIYDIAKYEKIPLDKIKKMMKDTLQRATYTSENKSASGIELFYNDIGCNDTYINCFNQHWKLQPFAKAIKLTIEKSLNGKLKECRYANFYIQKQVYTEWKKKGIVYEPTKDNLSVYDSKARNNKTTITMPTNYVVEHFKRIVKNLDMNISEVIITALDFFMKSHTDIFGEYGKDIDEKLIQENKSAFVFGYVDKELNNKIWQAIQRYNQVNTPPIKYGEFLESALAEKLEKLPIKYTNPKLFEEYKELLKENEKLEKELTENE